MRNAFAGFILTGSFSKKLCKAMMMELIKN